MESRTQTGIGHYRSLAETDARVHVTVPDPVFCGHVFEWGRFSEKHPRIARPDTHHMIRVEHPLQQFLKSTWVLRIIMYRVIFRGINSFKFNVP